eukprot:CAMPEP_0196573218 /NCGR_PEP_ID=MMETSP1081-20130531/3157_1 /TAXON_ID=36882 /ORGANISM="Pyramimonas amylifera, Strain CCMP720" /LENGTH=309 /DNA_ID=CAMNT_0041890851 /DNA_START=1 /DNA_END=930 /DNA_ORIENTATION=+
MCKNSKNNLKCSNSTPKSEKLITVCQGSYVPTLSDVVPKFEAVGKKGPTVVALGKFDALHIGHQALARKAASMGSPYLLSFSGMAEVLGWPARLPIVAPEERSQILATWDKSPEERVLPFIQVRHLQPEDFVRELADLGVEGIVTGSNYRFGYKASGDTELLQRLAEKHKMAVSVVDLVSIRQHQDSHRVSSTRVRECLQIGDMAEAALLLGRPHRCVLDLPPECSLSQGSLVLPATSVSNLIPSSGSYQISFSLKDYSKNDCKNTKGSNSKLGSGILTINRTTLELSIENSCGQLGSDILKRKLCIEF